jgi:hypothetical protein
MTKVQKQKRGSAAVPEPEAARSVDSQYRDVRGRFETRETVVVFKQRPKDDRDDYGTLVETRIRLGSIDPTYVRRKLNEERLRLDRGGRVHFEPSYADEETEEGDGE